MEIASLYDVIHLIRALNFSLRRSKSAMKQQDFQGWLESVILGTPALLSEDIVTRFRRRDAHSWYQEILPTTPATNEGKRL